MIFPSKNAYTAVSLAALNTAGLKPPILPTSYAKFKAGKSSTLGGINSRVSNSLKSKCFISRCIRLGYVKAY